MTALISNRPMTSDAEDRLIAWLAALAIAIHILETAVPSPLPGIKPGLANVVTLVVMMRYGMRTAIAVALLRILVGSLLIGTFLTPTFIMSLAGGLTSLAALALTYQLCRWHLSPLGYGVIAALAHMTGQTATAYTLFIPHPAILHLVPVLMTAALLLGCLSGIIASTMVNRLAMEPDA